jgi:hypothetical protein
MNPEAPTVLLWAATPCIEWQGDRDRRPGKEYGRVGTRRYGTRQAHAVAWIKAHGPIPPETPCVLHRCDNPPCVNVEHLFLGTHADNAADRAAKGRSARNKNGNQLKTHCPAGHAYDVAKADGARACRRCRAEHSRQYRLRRKRAAC